MNETNILERASRAPLMNRMADADILSGILEASTDACWCMEFGEPVDLTAPEREIVRQVFENDPYWSFTNTAMAKLYLLEDGIALNSRATSEIFPHNPQNEAFVLTLIANGFEVDAAPALDTRYDGVEIYVENDVRAHISGGKLYRMFGIVRDVGKQRHREAQVQANLDQVRDILAALPSAVLAFDAMGQIAAANPAAERLLGRSASSILGAQLSAVSPSMAVGDAAMRTIERGTPLSVDDGTVVWAFAPRDQGGAVAVLTPHSQAEIG